MKISKTIPSIAIGALLLSGCGGDSLDDPPVNLDTPPRVPPAFAEVRVLHTSPDAPIVDVFAGTTPIAAMQDVDYQVASGLLNLDAGDYTLRVEAETPAGNAEVLSAAVSLANDTRYNVFAVGTVANLETLVVTSSKDDVAADTVRAQVVHAAPNAPEVDVHVTAPDADIVPTAPLATLEFKDSTGQVEVPAGDYRIRITLPGTMTVVYDSGTVALAGGSDLLISATQNVATGASPVSLLVANGTGGAVLLDANTQAGLRVIHGIADAPAVDVIAQIPDPADATMTTDLTLVDDAAFKAVTGYLDVDGGDYVIDVAAGTDRTVVPIDDAAITLMDGVRYTALANNTLAMADLDLIVDDGRPIATAALVRIFHASQATGGVDIYVTGDGEIMDVDPVFTNVEYSTDMVSETGYVQLPADDYVVTVTPTGTKTEAIETGVLTLEANMIYTAIAVDGDMEGDGPQLILADGLMP
jgi:hypothetical protein